ncbi:urease accessory protein UreD (plasmid) [Hafnia alvei]|uniref:urease accessory protein UreD n=1 Tax=Hafnia alvei TaxID=569 RepID=UPI000B6ED127|nr:urease accessory protein UreD [Hafnia alvei]MBI0278615.1 urease accessory protein UreD [Hafnia alvei]PNL03910.1 urease accessory protein [Hafnia alvei]
MTDSQSCLPDSQALAAHIGIGARELADYQNEPAQMRSGAPGKSGYLYLGFEQRGMRSVLVDMKRQVPYLVQKALYWDEKMPQLPCVTMISTSSCILQGDRLALDVHVAAGACAHVTTQSATKIHSMNANYAAQAQNLTVEEKGYLEFMPDPVIPHAHARFISDTNLRCHPSGTLMYSEILMSGRKYHRADERFGFDVYSSSIRAEDLNQHELMVERFVLTPQKENLDALGVMQGFDLFGNIILLTPQKNHDRIMARLPPHFSLDENIASGVSRLPNNAGLIFKVLGNDSAAVKKEIRRFWCISREEILGVTLPAPFLWR